MRRSSLLAVVLAVSGVAAGAGVAAAATLRGRPPAAPAAAAPALATTELRRGNLSDGRLFPGTLGFGAAREVRGGGGGLLTRLPKNGVTLRRGDELYRVNDQPVVVFYGDTPMFRAIDKVGLAGNDVLQLRRNLAALGYGSRAVTLADTVDQPLLDQLTKWQKSLRVSGPGALRPGQVVIVPGSAKVSEVVADLGTQADAVILKTTAKTKVVSVPMSADDARTVKVGAKVTIVLPDGREAPGKVTAVSHSVVADPDAAEPPKRSVTVKPSDARKLGSLDSAPVQIRVTTVARKNVLLAPVTALVALREGGYGLQLVDGRLVAATTGAFAGGMVEVSGAGVTEGLAVVTAQ